jgi:hypothetical protein
MSFRPSVALIIAQLLIKNLVDICHHMAKPQHSANSNMEDGLPEVTCLLDTVLWSTDDRDTVKQAIASLEEILDAINLLTTSLSRETLIDEKLLWTINVACRHISALYGHVQAPKLSKSSKLILRSHCRIFILLHRQVLAAC